MKMLSIVNPKDKKKEIEELVTLLNSLECETIRFVDGSSYYEGCGVGGYFVYFKDTCLEVSKEQYSKAIGELTKPFIIISRLTLDGDSKWPMSRK